MANRKDYTLIGVAPDVQFGKNGGRFLWNIDHFESTSDGVTLAQVRVPTTPVDPNDAASKIYVDSLASGVDAKASVRAGTLVAGTLTTDFEAGDTIDGVTLAAGDRILIKNQAVASENGIFVVNATGVPTRAADADSIGELSGGTFVFIEEGAVQADTGWVISTNGSLTPGVDVNDWVQFSAAGVITTGVGLSQVGSVFNVNTGAATIAVDGSNDLIVDSSATLGQVLVSSGTIGTEAVWGPVDLANAAAVVGLLPQNLGGTGTDMSGFAPQSLMLIGPTNNVVELPIGGVDQFLQSDGTTASWVTVPSTAGAIMSVQATVDLSVTGSTAIGAPLPAGAYTLEVGVNVTTAADAAATLVVGDAGQQDRLMVSTANDPEDDSNFTTYTDHLYATATQVNALVATTATTGTATVTVRYIQP